MHEKVTLVGLVLTLMGATIPASFAEPHQSLARNLGSSHVVE
jgi:hypothetical protein